MNKKINIPLTLITICIWGFILYSLAEALWMSDELNEVKIVDENISQKVEKKTNGDSEFEYYYLEKDPFNSKVNKTIEINSNYIPNKPPVVKQESRIKFMVTGIVINGDNKNIVLNDETNSNVVFLKEGESYQGLKIIRVSKQEVELLHLSSGDKIISPLK